MGHRYKLLYTNDTTNNSNHSEHSPNKNAYLLMLHKYSCSFKSFIYGQSWEYA